MATALLPLGLAFLMLVVGVRLTLGELAAAFAWPRALLAGLAVQAVVLPLAALALARLFSLPADLALGLLLVAAAPGGITSNYIALAARADLALSIAMTLLTNLAAFLTVPAVLALSGVAVTGETALPLFRISLMMFAVTAVPLALGLALRRWTPERTTRLAPTLDRVATWVFAAIVLTTFIENRDTMAAHALTAGPAALALNLAAIGCGLAAGRFLALPAAQGRTIAIEAGMQNIALAIFISTVLLGRGDLSLVGLVYAVIMNVTALIIITAARKAAPAG